MASQCLKKKNNCKSAQIRNHSDGNLTWFLLTIESISQRCDCGISVFDIVVCPPRNTFSIKRHQLLIPIDDLIECEWILERKRCIHDAVLNTVGTLLCRPLVCLKKTNHWTCCLPVLHTVQSVCCCCHTYREHIPQQGSANKQDNRTCTWPIPICFKTNKLFFNLRKKPKTNYGNILLENCPSFQTVGRHLLTLRTFCSSGSSWTNHNKRIQAPVNKKKMKPWFSRGAGAFRGVLEKLRLRP